MRLDDLAFLVGQRPRLGQDRRGDPDLADVVEQRSELDALQRCGVEPELLADRDGHVADPARVRRRVLVLRLESIGERLDGGEECSLEALERERIRECELRLAGDRAQELELPIVQSVAAVERERDRAPAGVERDRDDRVCVGEGPGEVVRNDVLVLRPRDHERLGTSREHGCCGGRQAVADLSRAGDTGCRPCSAADDIAPVVLALGEPDRRSLDAEDPGSPAGDALDDLVELHAGRELARELEERLRTLGLSALGLVEPCVDEGDRRMSGEDLEKAQIVGVELVEPELRDHENADDVCAVAQRHRQERLLDLRCSFDVMPDTAVALRLR